MALSILFTKADGKGSAPGSGLPRGLFRLFFQTIPRQGHLDQNIFSLHKNTWIHFSFKKRLLHLLLVTIIIAGDELVNISDNKWPCTTSLGGRH